MQAQPPQGRLRFIPRSPWGEGYDLALPHSVDLGLFAAMLYHEASHLEDEYFIPDFAAGVSGTKWMPGHLSRKNACETRAIKDELQVLGMILSGKYLDCCPLGSPPDKAKDEIRRRMKDLRKYLKLVEPKD
ncbi:MAG: hypothetical protein CSA62_13865 [Planctomycetota bacterium]|nr:MAG: hypothetical protein CSA62_13865 [Planctomycetota bacterium]